MTSCAHVINLGSPCLATAGASFQDMVGGSAAVSRINLVILNLTGISFR